MPQFTLANYIAIRAIVDLAERAGFNVDGARDGLAALRKFFPSLEQWEREQAQKRD